MILLELKIDFQDGFLYKSTQYKISGKSFQSQPCLYLGETKRQANVERKWRGYYTLFETMQMGMQIKEKEVTHVRLILTLHNSLVSVCEKWYWADVKISLLWAYLASVACFAGGNEEFLSETTVKYYFTI
jgi:hypothetical protein